MVFASWPEHVTQGLELPSTAKPTWGLGALTGRLVEVSGQKSVATLTAAFGLVLEAQLEDEPVVWVSLKKSSFFPPDAAESGVSLAHLAVVRVAETSEAIRAAVELTRSGGFGLVVLDLGAETLLERAGRGGRRPSGRRRKRPSTPLLTKLVGLAQKHDTAVLLLTEKSSRESSLSSLVSLRAEARSEGFRIEVEVLKDKRRGPGRLFEEWCRAPAGLR